MGMAQTSADDLAALMDQIALADGALVAHLSALAHGAAVPSPDEAPPEGAEETPPEYPITPVFDERYDYVIVFAHEPDRLRLAGDGAGPETREVLQVDRRRSWSSPHR